MGDGYSVPMISDNSFLLEVFILWLIDREPSRDGNCRGMRTRGSLDGFVSLVKPWQSSMVLHDAHGDGEESPAGEMIRVLCWWENPHRLDMHPPLVTVKFESIIWALAHCLFRRMRSIYAHVQTRNLMPNIPFLSTSSLSLLRTWSTSRIRTILAEEPSENEMNSGSRRRCGGAAASVPSWRSVRSFKRHPSLQAIVQSPRTPSCRRA